jgi:FkbM family methyltransferase
MKYLMSRSEIEKNGCDGATQKDLAKILNCFYLYTDKEEQSVGQWLAKHGYWESWITSWMTKNIKEGDICLDVGANYGYYTRVMEFLSGKNGLVYYIEANPELVELINKSINDYPLNKAKVIGHSFAASDNNGKINLSISSKYIGGSTIVFGQPLPSSIESSLWDREIEVDCKTIDSLNIDKINVIKMDIEGAEYLAWKGMQKTLENTDVIVLEIGSYCPIEFIDDIYAKYEVSQINFDGDESPITKEEIYSLNDLIMAVLRKKIDK